jgi:hypothetical protein
VVERVLSDVVTEWQEQQGLTDDETIYVSRHLPLYDQMYISLHL